MIVEHAAPHHLPAIAAMEETFVPKERWSEAAWREELDAPTRTALVATSRDEVIGVILLAELGDAVDLLRIIVHPDSRRSGVADALMRFAIELMGERIMLEVRDDNEPAQRLYLKHGFVPIDRRRDYYAQGVDALVFERPVTEGALQ